MTHPTTGRLLVLVGPSGSGKTTLARRLIASDPDRRVFSVSHTTRPQRATETDGRDYHFVDRDRFTAMINAGALVEWAEVHGNFYGTSRRAIEGPLALGQLIVFDVDIEGAANLHRSFARDVDLVFIAPPSWESLVRRLVRRGSESDATLRRRLRTARTELSTVLHQVAVDDAPWSCLINDDLDAACDELEEHVRKGCPPMSAEERRFLGQILACALADPRAAPPVA